MSKPVFNPHDFKSFEQQQAESLSYGHQFTKSDADTQLNTTLNYQVPQTHSMFGMSTLQPSHNPMDPHNEEVAQYMKRIQSISKTKSSGHVDAYFDEPN